MESQSDQARQQRQLDEQQRPQSQSMGAAQQRQHGEQVQQRHQDGSVRGVQARPAGVGAEGGRHADQGAVGGQQQAISGSRGSRTSQNVRQSVSQSSNASRPSRASNARSDNREGSHRQQQINSAQAHGNGNESIDGGQRSATDGQRSQGAVPQEIAQVETIRIILGDLNATVDQQASASQSGQIQVDAEYMRTTLNQLSLKVDEHVQLLNEQAEFNEQSKEQMNQQMAEQQEEFFKKIQESEDEVEALRQQMAALKSSGESHQQNINLQDDASKGGGNTDNQRGQIEDQASDQMTYQEEELQAKKRKETSMKFSRTSGALQNLLEKNMLDQNLLSQRLEAVQLIEELSRLMKQQTQENKSLQSSRIRKDSKVKSLQENINFLEERLSSMLTEKEEQAIKLKSEIIICQQKAKQYKEKMLEQKEHYDSQNEQILAEKVELAKKEYLNEMAQIQGENQRQKAELLRLTDENKELADRNKEFEKEYVDVVKEKDDMIHGLEGKLQKIDLIHEKRLSKIGNKQDDTRKKLAIEEKDKELFGLKLEQVMVNNKKLMLQKKFLEKQLEKDLREIHLEMNKIQIEIQQDQLMNSSSALQRFRGVYQAVSDQLTYVQQIVGFMDFDQEGVPGDGGVGARPGGQQPQSYDDVVKEINEKFQPGRRPESGQGLPDGQQQAVGDEIHSAASPFSQGAPHGQSLHSQSVAYDQNQDAANESGMAGVSPGESQNQMTHPLHTQNNFGQNLNSGMGHLRANNMPNHRTLGQQQSRNALGGGQVGAPQQVLLTVEECLNSYPNELLYAVLEVLNENFKDAKIFESEHIQRLIELVQGQITNQNIVNEIYDKYLLQNRIQFSQYVHKINEKCKSLEIERKNLQLKVKRAKLDMKRIEQSEMSQIQAQQRQQRRQDVEGLDDEEELEPHQEVQEELAEDDGVAHSRGNMQPMDGEYRQPDHGDEGVDEKVEEDLYGPNGSRQTSDRRALRQDYRNIRSGNYPAVPGNLSRPGQPELEQQVDLLRQQNVALKERCKEIRLNLQRKITELQDTLTISKQKYMTELSELKVEYGKDLNRITRCSEEKQQELQQQFDTLKDEELEQLNKEFAAKEAELRDNIVDNEKRAKEAIEQAEIHVRDAERDLKKLKKESTGYFKGGWGTFIIAFEDEEALNELLVRKLASSGLGMGSPQGNTSAHGLQSHKPQLKKARKKAGNDKEKPQSPRSNKSKQSGQSDALTMQEVAMTHPHPIEKISHFVEVGFLIDRNNFRLLNTFEEATHDSNLKKYLFELQDPIDNFQMNDLEFKIKQQLTDNVGLFNEINPVYISLNMGRPSTPFFDEYVPQDQFRLIKREGLYLMQHRWMMINFLKCDYLTQQPNSELSQQQNVSIITNDTDKEKAKQQSPQQQQYILRVIAFENSSSSQFSFDLNFNDLLTLMHGNIKLLEDENSHDLCQIILNNLTMIQRKKVDKKGKIMAEDVLIVEHKVFFNEQYRAVYDKKNKNIMAKYDKKRQGLVKDVCLTTDYEKSVIYEAFSPVYQDQVNIQSSQRHDLEEILKIEILRGKMSGNIKLRVTFVNQDSMVKEMCLFAEEQQRSHKICSEIIHVGNSRQTKVTAGNHSELVPNQNGPEQSTLAYVVSLEKLYGTEDILVVRLVLIEKWDQNVMMEYSWNPEGRPQEGSTQFSSQTLYLVKKSDSMYCRVTEYEILNTEIRTLLFMHSYGYIQANVDFGNVRRYLDQGENRRVNYLSMMGSDEFLKEAMNVNIRQPAAIGDYKGQNQLIYRQFCVIRVRHRGAGQLGQVGQGSRSKNGEDHPSSRHNDGQEGQTRQSDGNEGRQRHMAAKANGANGKSIDDDQKQNYLEEFSNHYGLIAIFDDGQSVEKGELVVKVVIQEMEIDIICPVTIISEVVAPDQLKQVLQPETKIEVCEKIIDRLVLNEVALGNAPKIGDTQSGKRDEKKYLLKLDKDILPMSEHIAKVKQATFEETLRHEEGRNDDNKIEMELPDVGPLKVSLSTLADCPKASQMTLINQKLYKVTAYFVSNQRGFEPKMPQHLRMFDWHFVYVEVAQRSTDQQIVFGVTEKDIVSIVQKLRQKTRVEGKDIGSALISKEMSRDAILNLILDCFIMDAETFEVSLSMLHLNIRHLERSALEEKFIITGGRFVQLKDGQDPELADFKTVIPQTELTKKLIQNVQKDMSDKTFDVKIYELELKSIPGTKKIRFEIFWVDEPDIVFRCDMFSNENQDGSQIIIEKINIVEQRDLQRLQKGLYSEDQYDPATFAKDGLVLAICESNFPHQISFMLIEPCSHIQWEFSYYDDKLNVIETRQQRLNFVSNLRDVLAGGILRDIQDKQRAMKISPGEQQFIGDEQVKDTFYSVGSIQQTFKSSRSSCQYELIYAQSLEISPGVFRNLNVISDAQNDKIILRLAPIDDQGQQAKGSSGRGVVSSPRASGGQGAHAPSSALIKQNRELHISLNSQMEGSRVASGCMSYGPDDEGQSSQTKNLIYTVEVACALKRHEKAIRLSMFNQASKCSIVNVVFVDKSVFERDQEMRDEVKFALHSGFTDSLAIVQKMGCLNYDYQKYELNQEIKLKMEDGKSVDLMRDFRDSEPAANKANLNERSTGSNGRKSALSQKSKDEDSAFVSLAKLKERIINRSLKNNTLLYRKVMKLDKGRKNVMISALREDNQMYEDNSNNQENGIANPASSRRSIRKDKYLIKLVLFENKRVDNAGTLRDGGAVSAQPADRFAFSSQGGMQQYQQQMDFNFDAPDGMGTQKKGFVPAAVQKSQEYVFVYRYEEMFSYAEVQNNDLDDLRTLKRLVAQAVNRRLRIREIPDALDLEHRGHNRSTSKRPGDPNRANLDASLQPSQSTRYIAFFLDEKQINELPKNPSITKLDLLEGRQEFDMRQLHSFALLDPSAKVVPSPDKKTQDVSLQKQNLIYQFEKDDLLFEVFEILDPSELAFRFKVYERETFKMLTSCDIGEAELRSQLNKDRRSYLAGPQQREELAKYIIMNSFYDEHVKSLKFMVSDLMEELES